MIRIGEFAGAQVSLDYSDDVRIVLRWRHGEADQVAIRGLGIVLGGFSRLSCDDHHGEAEIRYTDELDRRLVALVDLLIDLRMCHPTMVQLPLQLNEMERQELEEVLNV